MSSTAAAVPEARRLPTWRYWLTHVVAAPIAAALFFYVASGQGDNVVFGAAATAALFAALYVAGAAFTSTDFQSTLGGYLLAALLTVPWGYGILIAAIVYTCEFTSGCPFS